MMTQNECNQVMMRDGEDEQEEGTLQISPSPKRKWLTCFLLLLIILAYLFAGALVFRALESPAAVQASENFDAALRRLASENDCLNEADVAELMKIVTRAIGEGGYDGEYPYATNVNMGMGNETSFPGMWTVSHAFVFVSTVVTTVGFGHLAPRTELGQLFCMFYAVIGIAITGGILLSVGKILQALCLSRIAARLDTYLKCCSKAAGPVLANITIVYLLMIIPISLLYFFTHSDWSYIDSHYFSVVAMTTIGFGDLQPKFTGIPLVELYFLRIVLFTYIFISLGAVSAVLDTFSDAQRKIISSRLSRYPKSFSNIGLRRLVPATWSSRLQRPPGSRRATTKGWEEENG